MRARAASVIAAALLLGGPGSVHAQGNRWERAVADHLARVMGTLQTGGAGPAEARRVGVLNVNETASFTMTLRAGVTYVLAGVCDDDCARLVLAVTTLDHSDRAVDRRGGNLPSLRFTPSYSGLYRIKMVMERCRVSPCWYGVGVLPRP